MKTPPVPPLDAPPALAPYFADVTAAFDALQREIARLKKRLEDAGIA